MPGEDEFRPASDSTSRALNSLRNQSRIGESDHEIDNPYNDKLLQYYD